jgi:hypothetical protein
MTPRTRDVIRSTSGFLVLRFLTRMAVLETTVSIALSPAARMVSPDSEGISESIVQQQA